MAAEVVERHDTALGRHCLDDRFGDGTCAAKHRRGDNNKQTDKQTSRGVEKQRSREAEKQGGREAKQPHQLSSLGHK